MNYLKVKYSTSRFELSVSIDIREIQWGNSQHLLFYLLENCNNRFIQPDPSVQKSRPRIKNSLGTDFHFKSTHYNSISVKKRGYREIWDEMNIWTLPQVPLCSSKMSFGYPSVTFFVVTRSMITASFAR